MQQRRGATFEKGPWNRPEIAITIHFAAAVIFASPPGACENPPPRSRLGARPAALRLSRNESSAARQDTLASSGTTGQQA
jgi:hypothetical protein